MADIGLFTAGITWTPALGAGPATDIEFGVVDSNGTWWLINTWSGMDGAPVEGQVVQRAGDHGGWATPQYYTPRPITLVVHATAVSRAQRDVARAFLQQAIPVSDLALLTWNDPIALQMQVRRSGPIVETYMTLADVEFSIPLIAPDPRKYGAVLQSQTAVQGTPSPGLAPPLTPPLAFPAGSPPLSVTVVNNGSFETRPAITIGGPISTPGVVNQTTGQVVSFSSLTLNSTDVLVVDLLNKQGLLNGVYRTADISSSWWVAPPGSTGVQITGTATSGAYVTVNWRDAYI